jgi:hypothetical protein
MATLQIRRGTAARLAEVNLKLEAGEPCQEYDTGKLKIGDGETYWNDLPYIGHQFSDLVSKNNYEDLPGVGDENIIYKVKNNKTLYQWNSSSGSYESLSSGNSFTPEDIKIINGGTANG